MKFDDAKIKNHQVHFGSVRMETAPSWTDEIIFLDQYPKEEIDANTKKFRIYLKSCHNTGKKMYPWAEDLILDMAEKFRKNHVTLIKFYGFGQESDSYPWHKDTMDVVLVQALGVVKLKIENTSSEANPRLFRPGHAVWIPRGTHHQVITEASRVTYSFGIEGAIDPAHYI